MKKEISLVLVLALSLVVEVANADFTFGEPTNLGPTVNSAARDGVPNISSDGLELYFRSNRSGGSGNFDLWVTTRNTKDDEWGTPTNLGPTVNTSASDSCPSISADGLSLFFMSNRPGGAGGNDVWVTTRAMKDDPWGAPVNLGSTVNGSSGDGCPSISADGLSLFFRAGAPGFGGQDLWVTTRAMSDDDWGPPVNLGATVNTAQTDCCPSISADGLALFFHSNRSGGSGDLDLWITTRATISDPWGTPVNLGPSVNISAREHAPDIYSDGSTLFFDSNRAGGVGNFDLWQVSIEPVVDLNGDGIVDAADMCIIVDNWGTDEPLCDIGPMPWGDGIVDVQDLIVLAEYLFEEFPPVE
jgi:Tol biopolymer transport system component